MLLLFFLLLISLIAEQHFHPGQTSSSFKHLQVADPQVGETSALREKGKLWAWRASLGGLFLVSTPWCPYTADAVSAYTHNQMMWSNIWQHSNVFWECTDIRTDYYFPAEFYVLRLCWRNVISFNMKFLLFFLHCSLEFCRSFCSSWKQMKLNTYR